MGLIYDRAKSPHDRKLVRTISEAQKRLFNKPAAMDANRLNPVVLIYEVVTMEGRTG